MTDIPTGIADAILRELKPFRDPRGWLAEIYRADAYDHQPAMAYISQTHPGVARGPHEHRLQTDLFVFAGPGAFAVYLYDNRPESSTHAASYSETFGADRPALLIVPPRVIHAYRCVSKVEGLVINLPDKLYAGPNKQLPVDEVRHEDDPKSPFYRAFERELFVNESGASH
jgi:dTDP-4-dehydrorhamnose 3,5-epimerase